jgi:tRNA G18 (ribose-2'-O)-methylase SpoU
MRKLTPSEIKAKRLPGGSATPEQRIPVYGLLDNIRSLYNVGSIFRTSDGALLRKLFLCGFTPAPPRKEIDKTSLGAVTTIPWESMTDPLEGLRKARSEGARICILEQTTTSSPYYTIGKSDFPLCLVVGNELTGISSEVIREADMAIEIPMYGMKQSLNVAVAFGIALFELVRILKDPGQG